MQISAHLKPVLPILTGLLSFVNCIGAPAPAESAAKALIEAAIAGDLPQGRALLELRTPPDCRDREGWTPLIHAAKRGDFEFCRILVARGADVNGQSSSTTGSRVIAFAASSGNLALLNFLLEKGADINGQGRNGSTALYQAATHRQIEIASYLINHGARVNMLCLRNDRYNTLTPLIGAALQGDIPMVRLLLSHGAKVDQRNTRGTTALMEVAKLDLPQLLKLLIESGANVNAIGPQGHTALIYAGYNGRERNIQLLLEAGADPTAEATDAVFPGVGGSYDAAKLARQQGHIKAFQLLSEAKARQADPSPGQ